jgi:GTP cyclohydrolase IA
MSEGCIPLRLDLLPYFRMGAISMSRPTNRKRAQEAVRALLEALGLDPKDAALADTPERTASAFLDVLAAGYATTPEKALGRGFPVSSPDPVVAVHLPLMFLCPHHLLPAHGVVHLAFTPKDRVPGLARLARMVDVLAHRLVLQEDLGRRIVEALADHLEVEAAVAIIEARHTCVAVEDFARRDTVFRTSAAHGSKSAVASLKNEIDASLRSAWSAQGDLQSSSASGRPQRKRPARTTRKSNTSR